MPYTTEAYFEYEYKHRDVSVYPGTSNFTHLIYKYSAEINTVMDEDSDFCTVSSATALTYSVNSIINELLEAHIKYLDLWKRTPAAERFNLKPPCIWDPENAGLRARLLKLKEDRKPKCYNFNTETGKVRRWG